jgi:uncharacterized membrane protein YhaH (DUF805 family)
MGFNAEEKRERKWNLSPLIFSLFIWFLSITGVASAQQYDGPGNKGACACGGILLLFLLLVIALNIALLVWVARDAKSRGMDNSVMWMILVMLTSVVGLIVYFLSRPKGELVPCQTCNNKRLQSSATCPHCGNP